MGVLDDIIVGVRADLAVREASVSLASLEEQASVAAPPIDPLPLFARPDLSVISEVKRSSPSKGALAPIENPAALAQAYERGGASAISVLTEQRRFGGSLADLDAVRAAVRLPVLRKDFIVTEYQLVEARAHGADLALLIVAALDDALLAALHSRALALGLTPLVEVHTPAETRRAVDLGARLIGVNNRNLQTLEVDLATFEQLAALIPAGTVKVAESGITGPADAARVAAAGADVILVGEALVRDGDPAAAIAAMIEAARPRR